MEVGTLFAEVYEIGDVLGEGGTGNVYSARRTTDDLEVALKIIHPHLVGNRQVNKRFHREAAILSRLEGSHLARIHDFGEDSAGLLYLAMERVGGVSLIDLLKDGPELPLRDVLTIMLAICAALERAHAAGVIHRDLKAENVTVQVAGGHVQSVHVLDFGLSKVFRGVEIGSTNLTEQNMVLGTPEYMAPEQVRGDELDERCDVYSAGIILYELLTGSVPFQRRTPVAVMTAHLTEPPPPPSSRASGAPIPPSLSSVVSFALAKRRRERYPSAASLAEAIRNSLESPDDMSSVEPPPPDSQSLAFRDTDEFPAQHAPTLLAGPRESLPWYRAVPLSVVVAILGALVGIAIGVICATFW